MQPGRAPCSEGNKAAGRQEELSTWKNQVEHLGAEFLIGSPGVTHNLSLGCWPPAGWLRCGGGAGPAEKVSCAGWLMCPGLEVPPVCGQMVPVPLRPELWPFGVNRCPTSNFPLPSSVSQTCWVVLEAPSIEGDEEQL